VNPQEAFDLHTLLAQATRFCDNMSDPKLCSTSSSGIT
jgi:hypothetical protein